MAAQRETENKEHELPGTSYYVRSQDHDTLSALRTDKEALKAALKAAVSQRDELIEKLKNESKSSGKKDLETENAQLKERIGELLRVTDDYKTRVSSTKSLEQRTKELEEEVRKLRKRHHKHSRDVSGGLTDMQRYAQFVVDKVKADAELVSLFRGRVGSTRHYLKSIDSGLYQDCLLQTLQAFSDILVFYEHRTATSSTGMQTLSDQGTNTLPTMRDKDSYFTLTSDTGKWRPRDTPSRSISSTVDEHFSPLISDRNGSDYDRLMQESEQLLSSIHLQNDRLSRLNTQIQRTVHGSRSTEHLAKQPKPMLNIPLSPAGMNPVQETLYLDELDSAKQTSTEQGSLPTERKESSASLPKPRPSRIPVLKKPLRKAEERLDKK